MTRRVRLLAGLGLEATEAEERSKFATRVEESILRRLPRKNQLEWLYRELCWKMGISFPDQERRWNPSGANDFDAPDLPPYEYLYRGEYEGELNFVALVEFLQCLHDIGAERNAAWLTELVAEEVPRALAEARIDLGVRWGLDGFLASGAPELDDATVDEVLLWLAEFPDAKASLEKGLRALLQKKPDDVLTHCYKALESVAQVAVGKPSANLHEVQQLFLSKLEIHEKWKLLASALVAFLNVGRHAGPSGHNLAMHEAEGCVYVTGAFLRLALESKRIKPWDAR